jgi:predicted ribosomally synthesized peptide with nif11-like leader
MTGEFDRLMADLRRHPDLLQDLGEIGDLDRAVRWANERGYKVEAEELRELLASHRELSADELEQAAGGDWGDGTTPPPGSGG